MEIICKICNNKSNSLQSFSKHILNHGYKGILKYYIEFNNFEVPKCECGKDRKLLKGIKFRKTCGNKDCFNKNKTHTIESKEKISNTMKKLHLEGKLQGWTINKDVDRRSYPEKWFIKNVLDKYDLYNKHTIKEKMSFHKYFLDFAIVDMKIDIEIDGQQHFRSIKTIEYDKSRDQFLINEGWRVCRIAWLELKNNPSDVIDNFLNWINKDFSYRKYDANEVLNMIKSKKPAFGNRTKYFENVIEKSYEKYKPIMETIENSNIDFSKYGWVKEVSSLTGIKQQKVSKWMKRYMLSLIHI